MLNLERRRSRIEVIADILRLGEASKTDIMYNVNMSCYQLQKYLSLLLELKLVEEATTGNQLVTYRVTTRGLSLLRDIDSVLDMLEGKEPIDLLHQHGTAKTVAKELSTL